MKQLLGLQQEFAALRKGPSAFSNIMSSNYDERFNSIILNALAPYSKGIVSVPSWYDEWCKASIAVRGQAIYMVLTDHKLGKNVHPLHFKALVSTMALESKLLPLIINKGTGGLNSNLVSSGKKGGAAFGLDQRQSSRKYDLVQSISTNSTDVFDLASIKKVVDFILNDINSNPDLRTYKNIIMQPPGTIKQEILHCVQSYEGLTKEFANQWLIDDRLAFYYEIFK